MIGKKSFHHSFHHVLNVCNTEVLEVSLFQLFRSVAKNLAGLMLPFYMYNSLGYELYQVALFYCIWQFCFTVVFPFLGKVIQVLGLKHTIALRSWVSIVFWLSIPLILQGDFWTDMMYLIPLLLVRAFCCGSSEVAYDIFLTHHMNKGKKGKTLAYIQVAIMLSAFLAPIIGGVITKVWGFEYVTYVAALFYILSGSVLMMTPDEKIEVPYSSRKFLGDMKKDVPKSLYISEFGRVFFDGLMWIIWPLFLVLIFSDASSLGKIVGVASGLSMVVAVFVGHWLDKKAQKNEEGDILYWGNFRAMCFNLLRGVWHEPVFLVLVDTFNRINQHSTTVPYDFIFYKWMRDHNSIERSQTRWFIAESVYGIVMGTAALFLFLFEGYERWVFMGLFMFGAMNLMLANKIVDCKK